MNHAELQFLDIEFPFKKKYGNFIDGKWVKPVGGEYFDNISPITGQPFTSVRVRAKRISNSHSTPHIAQNGLGEDVADDRANILSRIADRIETHLRKLAVAETIDKASRCVSRWPATSRSRSTTSAILRAAFVRRKAGLRNRQRDRGVSLSRASRCGRSDHSVELSAPAGCVEDCSGAGRRQLHCPQARRADPSVDTRVGGADPGPLPAGVLNVVNGFGLEAGKPLATSNRIAKISFTGETSTGRLIMQYASQNIIPVTLELGGKCPNIFFADVMDQDDSYFDKAIEGFTMFVLNQGEVCTAPSRVLIDEKIYDRFIERPSSVSPRSSRAIRSIHRRWSARKLRRNKWKRFFRISISASRKARQF